jgi:hypothetical protein
MAEWQIKHIKMRLEYAVKPADDQSQPPPIEFDPYEDFQEFPITAENLFVTDQPDNVPGKTILCLEHNQAGNFYAVHRLSNEIAFDFDTDGNLTLLQGALKVRAAYTDQDTGAEISDATYYPISRLHDFPVGDSALLPPPNQCTLILKKDDGVPSAYRLVSFAPAGGGAAPICQRLQCYTTTDPKRRQRCWRLGCYG